LIAPPEVNQQVGAGDRREINRHSPDKVVILTALASILV